MIPYSELTRSELEKRLEAERERFAAYKEAGLKLNMARGKPSTEQLNLVRDILTVFASPEDCFADGVDARNYGELSGLQCAKNYWAELLGCQAEEIFVGGNSSLTLMYDTISKAYTHGLLRSEKPWCKLDKVKFLCPAPGYDRHFLVTESFGAELITVPMLPTGPDMDLVEELIKDPAVKGMWCVPKYSNPDGYTYSDETIRRIAHLKPAAPDFALMWDNAYCIHEFDGEFAPFADILTLCREAGNPDMVYEFASTSKITLPGAGMSCLAASKENIAYLTKLIGIQIISYDKMNQLRHVRFLKDKAHTLELMAKHREILRPKFNVVYEKLQKEVGGLGIAHWTEPKGGYFISLYAMPGTAKRVWTLCKEAGVILTGAGATYPYGIDPEDSNLRIAPSFPPVHELEQAMDVLCCAVRLAALEKLLAK